MGGSTARVVDVRFVSATNHDLPTCVREGQFREDLFYRLGAASVQIPPIRTRPEDVADLAFHFLDELNRKLHTRKRLTPGTLSRIVEQRWPGNARELRNKIALLYHLSDDDDLRNDARDATPQFGGPSARAHEGLVTAVAPMSDIERDVIRIAVIETHGDCAEAARRLGISRSKVYHRIKKYGLEDLLSAGAAERRMADIRG